MTSRHGIPPPPDGIDERPPALTLRAVTDDRPSPIPLHFWERGPVGLDAVARPYRLRLKDGSRVRITHRKYWYLDRVEGTSRQRALAAIYGVLLHPRSWSRAGVHWVRVTDPAKAGLLVSVVPQDATACGPGSSGCFSWGWPDGKERAETGVEYIDRPGPFAVVFGMETCGHPLRALDMYDRPHAGYEGVMGDWSSAARAGWYPLAHEIESVRTWLRGETPADRVHEHRG